jgi:TDG/mug DNA glycosylase family protein
VSVTPAHLIEDVLGPSLRVVFCGTALGAASLAAKAYYAHPRNRFWPMLHEVGLTPTQFAPRDYARMLDLGIGLTDLCKFASGNDDQLPKNAFDTAALRAKIEKHRPDVLAFTSKTGGRAFCGPKADLGWQAPLPDGTLVYVLPSTSPSANGPWVATRHHWHLLAQALRDR